MLRTNCFRLFAPALVVAAALPFALQTGASGDDTTEQPSPCGCGDSYSEKTDAEPFEIVKFLHPRWSEESLRKGEDFALAYADVPGLKPDFYRLRVYADGEKSRATLVDRLGNETPFEAEFEVVGKRSVRLYVDVLGLGKPTDGGTADGQGPPPTELELDLTCGDDNWILVVWRNDDGSTGWDGECCDGEC